MDNLGKALVDMQIAAKRFRNQLEKPLDAQSEKRLLLGTNELIHIAASLVVECQLSEYKDDWPKCMPKVALREIANRNDLLRQKAAILRQIATSI